MTFAEKLTQLRKRESYTQEELADILQVSRQAISRWEMGSAVPDSSNLLRISKLFKVSADYLLNDDYESDGDIPAVQQTSKTLQKKYTGVIRVIVGGIFAGMAALAIIIMNIMASVGDYTVSAVIPENGAQVTVKRGLSAFLQSNNIEWLFALCIVVCVTGIAVMLVPVIKRKR